MNSENELVLLDIFSYSCMNCLRSLEYIKKIDNKYKRYGLQTILIHPPEWNFEKDDGNIANAIKQHKINFPIIIDDSKKIIGKLKINFWPAQILIKNGKILYRHVGEGNYMKLEDYIIKNLDTRIKRIFAKEPEYSKFPALYCGKKKKGRIIYLPKKLKFGIVYKKGFWLQKDEFLESIDKSSLTISTKGNAINFVARSLNGKRIKVVIFLDDKFIKNIGVQKPMLYNLIKIKDNKQHKVDLRAEKGLAIYSFSFQ